MGSAPTGELPRREDVHPDDRLMAAFGWGDAAAAERLYLRFAPAVFGIGLRTFGDVGRAEALVEAAFLKLRRRASRFTSSRVDLDTWVVAQALGVTLQMERMGRQPEAGPRLAVVDDQVAGSAEGTRTRTARVVALAPRHAPVRRRARHPSQLRPDPDVA